MISSPARTPSRVSEAVAILHKSLHPAFTTTICMTSGHSNTTQGARVYYLRNILHDWSEQKCLEILASVKPSMAAEGSVLLIDEIVLPEKGAPWRAAQLDIEMLVHLAGAERTGNEWRRLLDAAGFEVKRIRQYSLDRGECVIEARLKQDQK